MTVQSLKQLLDAFGVAEAEDVVVSGGDYSDEPHAMKRTFHGRAPKTDTARVLAERDARTLITAGAINETTVL